MSDKIKSMRFPADVLAAADARAAGIGLTTTEYVVMLLRRDLGLLPDAKSQLMAAVYEHVQATQDPAKFDEDVTRIVFRHIRDDRPTRRLYDAAIAGDDGAQDDDRRGIVNRHLGKMIRLWLKADKRGRDDGPLDDDELIMSYALLRPAAGQPGGEG